MKIINSRAEDCFNIYKCKLKNVYRRKQNYDFTNVIC